MPPHTEVVIAYPEDRMRGYSVDKVQFIKKAAVIAATACVGTMVKTTIRSNFAPANGLDKVAIVIGSYAIGAMIGEQATQWAEKKVEQIHYRCILIADWYHDNYVSPRP